MKASNDMIRQIMHCMSCSQPVSGSIENELLLLETESLDSARSANKTQMNQMHLIHRVLRFLTIKVEMNV